MWGLLNVWQAVVFAPFENVVVCPMTHTLEKECEDLKIAGCWVHCRRRFNDALEVIPKAHRKESILHLIMKQIQAIYREGGK